MIFGFRPVRSYGNNENGFIAIGLPGRNDYTIDLYNFYIEILKLTAMSRQSPASLAGSW